MPPLRHQYKSVSTDSGESEDIPLVTVKKRPLPRICKCPHSVLAELVHKGRLHASHPRFGPFYREDESEVSGKKEAWNKILEKSPDKNKTIESYLYAVRRIEKEARASYADGAFHNLMESEFRWMMIEDGCYFLHLALLVLGVSSKQLGYPDNHIIFGKKQNKEDMKKWIESMFFVGNQIPLVVLNELMKQSFFQTIIEGKEKWEMPSDLLKRILYELLVLPELDKESGLGGRTYWLEQQPSDLLHALHCLVLGPGGLGINILEDETGDEDLEAGDYKEAKDMTFSATELAKKGIRFQKLEDFGCRKISFKDYTILACLCLPVLKVDDDTELLYKSLKYYEMSQPEGKSKCDVRSYLNFMNDLICTYEDVKLLAKKGIIKTDNLYYKEKLPTMLSNLAGKDKNTTQNLHLLRIQLRDYNTAPWERFKIVAILLFVLTIVQTFFAMLAYFKPPPQK